MRAMLLLAFALAAAPALSRGPVLVGVTPDSAWVAWETDATQADATVKLGTTAGSYPGSVSDPTPSGGVRYFSRDWGQVHFAVLDTFDQTGPAVDPKLDTVSAAQLEWLKADLDAAQARRQIIFVSLHHGAVSHATGPEAHGGSDLVRKQVV